MPDADYGACATTSAALRLRRSFCSGLYEAFKSGFAAIPMGMDIPGFAARLIAPVLRGCDTKSFVSLTSLSLVHRPAAFAGYPPLPRAVWLFLKFLILLNLFIQLPIMLIMSCKKYIFRPYYFLNFRNLQPESIFVKGCFKILNKKIQIQSKSELTDILCICNIYSTGKSEERF